MRGCAFLLRLNVGMGMLQYGFYKVFPVQMQPPNLAVLNEPVGNTCPDDAAVDDAWDWCPCMSACAVIGGGAWGTC